jgi:exopolysaccharide biosynthesis polyprenyl glycosylphosphotransferase
VDVRPKQIEIASVVCLDALLIAVSALVAEGLRRLPFLEMNEGPIPAGEWTLPLIGAVWLLALAGAGAYSRRHFHAGVTEYKRVVTASLSVAGAVGVACFMTSYDLSRSFFLVTFGVGMHALLAGRVVRRQVAHSMHRRDRFLTPVLVVGGLQHVDSVATTLRREKWLGYHVVGALTPDRDRETPAGLPVFGDPSRIADTIRDEGISCVIFAEGAFSSPAGFRRAAWELEQLAVQMIVVPNLADISAKRLDVRPVAGLPLVDVERPQAIPATRWLKRSVDFVGSLALLTLLAPVMAAVALAIKFEDGGPVLFRQVRVGRAGEVFHCLKFRSMVTDAEARLAALAALNEGAGPLFKMTNDPRITRIGRVIRRYSLDELPQLWNVLRGDMSLVGPRPALTRETAEYDDDTRRRLEVRPGLTGLWQVSGRSRLSWEDTVRLDLYYVDNWSMTQDLVILAKTAKAVVGSDGAY